MDGGFQLDINLTDCSTTGKRVDILSLEILRFRDVFLAHNYFWNIFQHLHMKNFPMQIIRFLEGFDILSLEINFLLTLNANCHR